MSTDIIEGEIELLKQELANKEAKLAVLKQTESKIAALLLDKTELENSIGPNLKKIKALQVEIAQVEQQIKPSIEALERIETELIELRGSV